MSLSALRIFEGYLGDKIENWTVYGRMLQNKLMKDNISEIKSIDIHIPCSCEHGEVEEKFNLEDDKDVRNVCDRIEDTHAEALFLAARYLKEIIEEMTLEQILEDYSIPPYSIHYSIGNSYELKKYRKQYEMGKLIVKKETSHGYTTRDYMIANRKKILWDYFYTIEEVPKDLFNWQGLYFSLNEDNQKIALSMVENKTPGLPEELFEIFKKLNHEW